MEHLYDIFLIVLWESFLDRNQLLNDNSLKEELKREVANAFFNIPTYDRGHFIKFYKNYIEEIKEKIYPEAIYPILEILDNEGFLTKPETKKGSLKKEISSLSFINTATEINVKATLPHIIKLQRDSNIENKIKEGSFLQKDMWMRKKNYNREFYTTNAYITGYPARKDIKTDLEDIVNTGFIFNSLYIDILSYLFKSLGVLFKENENMDSTEYRKLCILMSNLLKIKFPENSEDPVLKEIFRKFFYFDTIKNLSREHIDSLTTVKHSYHYYNNILNKLEGFRREFQHMVYAGFFSMHFKEVFFDMIVDPRGRVCATTGISYTSMKMMRPFLNYSRRLTVHQLNKSKNLQDVKKKVNQNMYRIVAKNPQINTTEFLEAVRLHQTKWLFQDFCEFSLDYGDLFELITLSRDLIKINESLSGKKINTCLETIVSLDSISSGTQMISLLLKDSSLAKITGIVETPDREDIYTQAANILNNQFNLLWDYLGHLNQEIYNYMNTKGHKISIVLENIQQFFEGIMYQLTSKNVKNFLKLLEEQLPGRNMFLFLQEKDFLFEKNLKEKAQQILPNYIYQKALKTHESKHSDIFIIFVYFWLQELYNNLVEKGIQQNTIHQRSFVKRTIMTIPYGSTAYGRNEQYVEAFFKKAMKDSWAFEDVTLLVFKRSLDFINKIMMKVVKQMMPSSLEILEVISTITNFNAWKTPLSFNNNYVEMFIYPLKVEKKRRRVGLREKDGRRKLLINCLPSKKELDPDRLKSALLANLIHYTDAICAQKFLLQCKKANILGHTIHDRFFLSIEDEEHLIPFIRSGYLEIYDSNLLIRFFKENLLEQESFEWVRFKDGEPFIEKKTKNDLINLIESLLKNDLERKFVETTNSFLSQ